MKSVVAALVGVAGMCVAASGATTVQVLISYDGVNFSSMLAPSSGMGLRTVEVLVNVSTNNPAAIGLGSMIFQPTVSSWAASDVFVPLTAAYGSNTSTPAGVVPDAAGQYGRIGPWGAISISTAQRLTGHVNNNVGGVNYLRVAQAQVTSWIGGTGNTTGGSGVNIKQLNNIGRTASDPAFNGATMNVHVFRFAVQLDTNMPGRSTFLFDAPLQGFGNRNTTTGEREVYWYADMNEATGSIREVPTIIPALIAPSPGAVGVLGLGALMAARRRRCR